MTTSHPTASDLRASRAELTRFVREQADLTIRELGFGWVGVAAAPSTYQQLRGAFAHSQETGDPLPVSSLFCESTIYESPEDNIRFRYYHDVHHVRLGLSFNLDDELELAQWHLNELTLAGFGKGSLPYELLTADLVGQIFLMGVIGRFPFDQSRFVVTCHEAGLVSGLLAGDSAIAVSGGDPGRIGGRFLEACVGVLLAAIALYAAISILRAIWLYLCIVVLVVGVGALLWWRISSKYRGW